MPESPLTMVTLGRNGLEDQPPKTWPEIGTPIRSEE